MTDVEFEDLLEAVTLVMGTAPLAGPFEVEDAIQDAFHDAFQDAFDDLTRHPPQPANDNTEAWPHLPFPAGWTASC